MLKRFGRMFDPIAEHVLADDDPSTEVRLMRSTIAVCNSTIDGLNMRLDAQRARLDRQPAIFLKRIILTAIVNYHDDTQRFITEEALKADFIRRRKMERGETFTNGDGTAYKAGDWVYEFTPRLAEDHDHPFAGEA